MQRQYNEVFFGYFENASIDGYLTAYTYLLTAWLENGDVSLPVNKEKIRDVVKNDILHADVIYEMYFNVDTQAKSMAMLALATHGDINLQQALEVRQTIVTADIHSSILQALALKLLGADPALYLDVLNTLQQGTYLDQNVGISNKNSDKCIAAMTYSKQSAERETLLSEVIAEQQKQGHFGSTFANGICAMALRDKAEQNIGAQEASFQEIPTEHITADATHVLQYPMDDSHHWVRLQYQQLITDAQPEANGMAIERIIEVKRNDQWLPLSDTQTLVIGDLVRTTLNIDSGTQREHIAITDSIAGGFEALNPSLENELYQYEYKDKWFDINWVEIRNGKALWYLRNLNKGKTSLTYFSRVRHIGAFNIAPAKAEAMYRTDVYGSTSAEKVLIEQ